MGKLYKIVSKAPNPPLFSLPAPGATDPIALGGSVEVKVGAGTLNCTLAAGAFAGSQGWKGLGNPAGSKGYKYINKLAPTNDPCKTVIIKEKVIKVLAKSVGTIALPVDSGNPDVAMYLAAGADEYCALAVQPHFKEKADTLIKMKTQAAPASCARCGDDSNNRPEEECDGTDDSACPGSCVPPGGGPGTCGDNMRNGSNECTCAVEQCDGTDSSECQGLCLPNCTCPEPVCNNGVKEVGEVCDPAGSTADCGPGEICGGFCECVTDEACNCGSSDPTLYLLTGKAPVQPSCGTTDGGPPIDSLDCGGLYIGGGGGALPVPNMMPDEWVSKWSVAQCKGTDLTLTHSTQAQTGLLNCTQGKRCSGGTNDGEPCVRDFECDDGACVTNCFFGSPISILNELLPPLSTCAVNEIAKDSSGSADCSTGESRIRYPMDTSLYLSLVDQSASTPGYNPCPVCFGGTLNVPDSGTCEGGPNHGQACMPQSTSYDMRDCCAGGANNSKACSDDSDCPGSSCVSGCTIYPTSHDCPPNPLGKVGGIIFTLDLTADTSAKTADGNGNFCGWCRDTEVEGSGCFEGDPDQGPPAGASSCPDSTVIACRPETYHGGGGGDPADIVECGDPLPCRTDADCTAPYETCTQRNPGAWRDATTRNISLTGIRPGSLADHLPHPGALATAFCIPPTFNPPIDGDADLGGPGGLSLEIEMELSPSGAFLDLTPELLQ